MTQRVTSSLSSSEFQRYSRHLMLNEIGETGQLAFKQACVLIVGVGGLGCSAAQFLAASGIGHIILLDADSIERSNLQRQVLFKTNHLGMSKVEAAQKQLAAMNPEIQIDIVNATIEQAVSQTKFQKSLSDVDVVLDCTDNAESRYFINQLCIQHQKILVSAAAIQGQGQLISFNFSQPTSPCYQCLFPHSEASISQNCANSGVISPLLGVVGSLQAAEVLRLLLGKTDQLNQLITVDLWSMQFAQFTVKKVPHCGACQQ